MKFHDFCLAVPLVVAWALFGLAVWHENAPANFVTSLESVAAILTPLLLLGTLIVTIVNLRISENMHEENNVTRHHELRAYLSVKSIQAEEIPNNIKYIFMRVSITNIGRTPSGVGRAIASVNYAKMNNMLSSERFKIGERPIDKIMPSEIREIHFHIPVKEIRAASDNGSEVKEYIFNDPLVHIKLKWFDYKDDEMDYTRAFFIGPSLIVEDLF